MYRSYGAQFVYCIMGDKDIGLLRRRRIEGAMAAQNFDFSVSVPLTKLIRLHGMLMIMFPRKLPTSSDRPRKRVYTETLRTLRVHSRNPRPAWPSSTETFCRVNVSLMRALNLFFPVSPSTLLAESASFLSAEGSTNLGSSFLRRHITLRPAFEIE